MDEHALRNACQIALTDVHNHDSVTFIFRNLREDFVVAYCVFGMTLFGKNVYYLIRVYASSIDGLLRIAVRIQRQPGAFDRGYIFCPFQITVLSC